MVKVVFKRYKNLFDFGRNFGTTASLLLGDEVLSLSLEQLESSLQIGTEVVSIISIDSL